MAKLEYTQAEVTEILNRAMTEASNATQTFLATHGDRDACGFAWVDIYGVKGSTKLGKLFKAAGLRKDWTGKAFQLWNPAKSGTQSISALEAGAEAAAKVFKQYGFEAYAGSRLD